MHSPTTSYMYSLAWGVVLALRCLSLLLFPRRVLLGGVLLGGVLLGTVRSHDRCHVDQTGSPRWLQETLLLHPLLVVFDQTGTAVGDRKWTLDGENWSD